MEDLCRFRGGNRFDRQQTTRRRLTSYRMPASTAVEDSVDGQHEHENSLYAALGRSLTRSAALYFSRPVRLFRPSKGVWLPFC